MEKTLITRADDFGSCHAANVAIIEAIKTGHFIQNVSCMATGPMIEEAAEYAKSQKSKICFGLHSCITAEWDYIKWLPVSDRTKIPSLMTEDGTFPPTTDWYQHNPPDLDQIIYEYENQLDLLVKMGINVQYIDSHMIPEIVIPGLDHQVEQWAKKKGLIHHTKYYIKGDKSCPHDKKNYQEGLKSWKDWLEDLTEGQHLSWMHPTKMGREALLLTNQKTPLGFVACGRDVEYQLLKSNIMEQLCEENHIQCIRYDEAV